VLHRPIEITTEDCLTAQPGERLLWRKLTIKNLEIAGEQLVC